ncbi:MAG TPA: anaerobic ribonucleoside-triphosphate reductase activating protein [Ruminococcaceae bacterium]|nr:anaerobic ribonucleoside-triphosphate reductase activating protein [Oscillospiraceae bacterium]
MAMLKISGTIPESIVDGKGIRYVIFTQGCPHRCPGCQNPQTHDFAGGKPADTDAILREISQDPLLRGVTFSGGEPFCQPAPLAQLAREIHRRKLDVTVYTGYTLEELWAMHDKDVDDLLAQADVLVDGRFVLAQRDLTLRFRGSRNQRLIDMNKTRGTGEIAVIPD